MPAKRVVAASPVVALCVESSCSVDVAAGACCSAAAEAGTAGGGVTWSLVTRRRSRRSRAGRSSLGKRTWRVRSRGLRFGGVFRRGLLGGGGEGVGFEYGFRAGEEG